MAAWKCRFSAFSIAPTPASTSFRAAMPPIEKQCPCLIVNARIVLHQPVELGLHSGMRFGNAVGGFEDERLRGMKSGGIRRAARLFVEALKPEHLVGQVQKLLRFVEKGAGLLLHSSMPSARMAYISGMRGSL